jgi:hypothetical protein
VAQQRILKTLTHASRVSTMGELVASVRGVPAALPGGVPGFPGSALEKDLWRVRVRGELFFELPTIAEIR